MVRRNKQGSHAGKFLMQLLILKCNIHKTYVIIFYKTQGMVYALGLACSVGVVRCIQLSSTLQPNYL
jgi:hypothetical protein